MGHNTVTVANAKSASENLSPDYRSPLILDDSLDYPGPEESSFVEEFSDGFWAKSGGLVPMSAYEKESQAGLFEYDESSVTFENPASFDSFSNPSFTARLFPQNSESSSASDDESVPAPSHEFSGSPFELTRSPSLEASSPEAPEVMSFSPTSGPDGCRIAVYLQSTYDLLAARGCTIALSFGSARSECAITALGFQNGAFQYALLVDAPAFSTTGCLTSSVPLQIIVDVRDGSEPHVNHIGNFNYDQELPVVGPSPPRKRRMSSASDETMTSTGSVKQARVSENIPSFAYNGEVSTSPYSPYIDSPNSSCAYSPAQYHAAVSPALLPTHSEAQQQHLAQLRVQAPSPLSATWSPGFSSVSASTQNPSLSTTSVTAPGVDAPVRPTANPLLVRTSTIQQSLAGSASGHRQPFNPYAMYPTKAVLKLSGDLDAMAENWTKEERQAQRRLVQFTRRQDGSTIYADFKPVAPADRLPNSICISCIHWASKDECYVTSVDTIYLLECLVGVRFTVEEKNRIRRNLEGFRPLTVSKTKPESEEFFKVIMGFPNPKPRNIEKDVKVFPWRILGHALKKIIGKYSASYSSTAGALPATLGSNYGADGTSDPAVERRTPSPHTLSKNPIAYGANPGMFKWSSRSSVPPSVVSGNSQVQRSAGLPLTATNGALQAMQYDQSRMHLTPLSNVHGSYLYASTMDGMTTVPSQQSDLFYPSFVPSTHGLALSSVAALSQPTPGP
ncbi:hypothetical protein VTO42DRAFT_6662 [Malbranchea cinnamomea]